MIPQTRTRPPKAGAHPLASQDRWLLSYADFVTLLLAVFLVLFAYQQQRRGSIHTVSTAIHSGFEALRAGSPPLPQPGLSTASTRSFGQAQQPSIPPNAGELARQLQGVLEDAINKHEVVVQATTDGLTVRLQELGFFSSGGATLLPEAVRELQRTARVLAQSNLEMHVEGHSDDQPIHTAAFHSNWELSTARAMSVLSVLVDQAAFPPNRVAVMGYGPYRPIADNATEDGRRKNRRVDLVIIMPHTAQDIRK